MTTKVEAARSTAKAADLTKPEVASQPAPVAADKASPAVIANVDGAIRLRQYAMEKTYRDERTPTENVARAQAMYDFLRGATPPA